MVIRPGAIAEDLKEGEGGGELAGAEGLDLGC